MEDLPFLKETKEAFADFDQAVIDTKIRELHDVWMLDQFYNWPIKSFYYIRTSK